MSFKKITAPVKVVPKERPPETEIRTLVQEPAKVPTKPVVIALLLLALPAFAQVSITAPQGGAGACPFPGCRGQLGTAVITDPPFNVSPGTADMSSRIQQALDSGATEIRFPPGTFTACGQLLRRPSLTIFGAGKEATTIQATPSCVNLFLGSTQGPVLSVAFEKLTLKAGAATLALINIQGRDMARFRASNMAMDVGNAGDAQGMLLQGIGDILIENNEFYSSVPGHGKPVVLTNSPRRPIIRNNTCKWTYNCFEWGTGGADGARFESNTIQQGWAFLPTKFTNSGGTVTYADGVLTDSAANFQGLCDDVGSAPATCGANLGNHVRVMTPIVTRPAGNVNFNSGGSVLTDAGGGFVVAGVKEGDIIRTAPICRGNGQAGSTIKQICTAAAGTGKWGDRCDCTTNADCASGVCRPRFTFVIRVNDATHLSTEEWMDDVDRRPTTAPLQPSYTVYSWVTCSVGSYTTTTATCSATTAVHFKDWGLGTVVTPANGTLYEIMTRHPNYPFIEAAAATNSFIAHNIIDWGFSDNIFTTGLQPTVLGNTVSNSWDHGLNIQGTGARIIGNHVRHFGARGVANFSPHSVMDDNIGMDGPITATGSSNCPVVVGFTSGLPATVTNSKAVNNIALATSTSGICVQNQSDGVSLDNSTCLGTFATACIRNDTVNNVNTRITNYHGETISNAGSFSIEGGRTTFALGVTPNAAQAGSIFGCSDCNVAAPCTSGGGGAIAIRSATGPAWNCR